MAGNLYKRVLSSSESTLDLSGAHGIRHESCGRVVRLRLMHRCSCYCAAAAAAGLGCDCAADNNIGEAGAVAVAKALESGQCGLTSLDLRSEADSARARSVSFGFVGAPCAMVDAVGGGVEAWMVAVSDASLSSLLLLLLLLLAWGVIVRQTTTSRRRERWRWRRRWRAGSAG